MMSAGGGELFQLDVGLDRPLQEPEFAHLGGRDEGDGRSLVTGAARASDAVDIAVGILRQRVVDYVREVAYVDAPGRHVRSHQDIDLFFLEFAQDLLALGLRNVAVKDFGRIAAFQEFGHDIVRARSGAGEDDAVELRFDVDDAGQGVEFVAFAHLEIDLVRQVGRDVLRFDLQEVGFVHVVAGQRRDAVGHRGREE